MWGELLGRAALAGAGLMLSAVAWLPVANAAPTPKIQSPPSRAGEAESLVADRVLVDKSERRLYLLHRDRVVQSYDVALGERPRGDKLWEGDGRTPEGDYVLDWRNPDSDYFLSLHVSYPNRRDQRRAERLGVTPGGAIMIHGSPNWFELSGPYSRSTDWTDGCIAVSNRAMVEIWHAVEDGTPITIQP